MSPQFRRASRLVAAILFAACVPLLQAPSAGAAACSGGGGVGVVVDFAAFGNGVQVGCAVGDPTSGLGALQAAGFGYSFVPNRPGFVCRISERPDPCNGAPATAYWSYWTAQPGGSWVYSTVGAGNHDPAPGNVEGWAFGAGSAPSVSPPAAAAPPTQPPAGSDPTQPPPSPIVDQPAAVPPAEQQPADTRPDEVGAQQEPQSPSDAQAPLAGAAPMGGGWVGRRGDATVAPTSTTTTALASGSEAPPLTGVVPSSALGAGMVTTAATSDEGESRDLALASAPGHDREGGGGGAAGAVAGAVLVGAVAGGAFVAHRRRRAGTGSAGASG